MKLSLGYSGLLLAVTLALGAVAPAMADDAAPAAGTDTTTTATTTTDTTMAAEPITVSGKVTEPNFQAKIFWVNPDANKSVAVVAGDADIKYNGQTANVYRMMGTPTATVTGTMRGNLLYATSVTITSGPAARLQQSSYTDQAVPAFGANDLVPLHVGDGGTAGGGTGTDTTATTPPANNTTTKTHSSTHHTRGKHHGRTHR